MLGLFFYELFVKDNMSEEKYRNLKEKYGIEVSEETWGRNTDNVQFRRRNIKKRNQSRNQSRIDTRTIEFITRIMQSKNFDYAQAARYLELTEKEQIDYQMYFMKQ